MEHSFCIKDAVKYSIEKAIILKNLRFWLDKNKANGKHGIDGYYWTYNSSKAFGELFPYMSEKSIARWLGGLEKDGVLKSGSYNKSAYDRTKWYTIPAEYAISQNEESTAQNDISIDQNEKSKPQNEEPIPDINTDNKPDINTEEGNQWPDYVTPEIEKEVKQLRKNAKAPLTERSKKMLIKELDLAIDNGYTIDQCMDQWSVCGWRSFKAEWMTNKVQPLNTPIQVLKAREALNEQPTEDQKKKVSDLLGSLTA